MRKTSGSGRKTTNESQDESSSKNSESIQLELELLAVKAKNAELTKAHAKLVHENYSLSEELLSLRQEMVDILARSNSVESQITKLGQEMSRCTPSLIDILNLFLSVTDKRKTKTSIFSSRSRISEGYTPRAKAITHTVKPHTVNGTVLNLTPTISLTRLNSSNNQNEESGSSIDYMNSLPSTSGMEDNILDNVGNENPLNSNTTSEEFVLRTSQVTSAPFIAGIEASEMEVENEAEPEESSEGSESSQSSRRLSTIPEESVRSSRNSRRSSIGEIRIYLSRLSAGNAQDDIGNESHSSTSANVNDTCLNIETTVIEDPEDRVSKRLRADIMVFSPHTNSTIMENDQENVSDKSTHTPGICAVSAIQSAEVTPSSGILNDEGLQNCSPLDWMPTPSMSAMGDIDRSNYSRLEILTETERKLSPRPTPPGSPLRTTRSKTRKRGRNRYEKEDSPRSSRGVSGSTNRSLSSFISRQRRTSEVAFENALSPTIMLERMENTVMERMITRSHSPMLLENGDPTDESENIPNNIHSKRRKTSSKSNRSRSKSAKRKKPDEANSLQEKIREVQIRLSNYKPEVPQVVESPPKSGKRPQRAAKPMFLKDASLKGKLRRLI